jgi:excisionase family DNA binding protein
MGLRVRDETDAIKPRQLTENIMAETAQTNQAGQLPATPEVFIGKNEVARRLNKTLRTVDNWMQRGLLPYYKIGRSVVFKWSDVETQLAQTCRVARGGK